MFGTAAWKAANRSRATAESNSFEGLLRPVWLIILDAYSAVEWTTQHSLHPLFTLNRCYHQQVTAAISDQHSEKRPPRSLRRNCTKENLKGLRYWVADDMKNYHPLLQKIASTHSLISAMLKLTTISAKKGSLCYWGSNLEFMARPGLLLSRATQDIIFDPSITAPSNGTCIK
jgi:hypothetical protein